MEFHPRDWPSRMLLTAVNSPTVNTLLKHIAARGNGRESDDEVGVKGGSRGGSANYCERAGHVSSIRHRDIIRFDPRIPFGTTRWRGSRGWSGPAEKFWRDSQRVIDPPPADNSVSTFAMSRVDNHVIFLSTLFRHASHNSGPTGYPSRHCQRVNAVTLFSLFFFTWRNPKRDRQSVTATLARQSAENHPLSYTPIPFDIYAK